MMRENENVFIGKWKIVSLYGYVEPLGWVLVKRYGRKSMIWEFTPLRERVFPVGGAVAEGLLLEHHPGLGADVMEYIYYATNRLLYIDRSHIAGDSFVEICLADRYRVEQITETEYWLYDLEDVETEPEDYRYRIKIRKLCLGGKGLNATGTQE